MEQQAEKMTAHHLRLSYPVSANRYWRTFKNRVVRSAEANAYRREVAWPAPHCLPTAKTRPNWQ